MANIVDIVIRGIDKTKQGFTQPIRSLEDLGAAASKLAPIMKLASVAVAGAFSYMVKSSIDLADTMAKTSQKIGISVESLSAMRHAASLSGVEFESLVAGLRFLNKNMADAAAGTGDARLAFQAMGVEVKNASGKMKTTEDILSEMADKFASYEDGANKTAIAMRVFGKAGADLIPFLNAGSSGINELMEEAKKLGIVIDTKTAKVSEEFNDNMERLKSASSGLALSFATEIVPALAEVTTAMVAWVKESGAAQKVSSALAESIKVVAGAAIIFGKSLHVAGTAIGGFASVVVNFLSGNFRDAEEAFSNLGPELAKGLDEASAALKRLSDGTATARKEATGGGKGKAPFLIDEKALAEQRKLFEENAKALSEYGRQTYDDLVDAKIAANKFEMEQDEEKRKLEREAFVSHTQYMAEAGREAYESLVAIKISATELGMEAVRKASEEEKRMIDGLKDWVVHGFDSMANAVAQFVTTGKLNFKDFVDSLIADLARLAAKMAILQGLKFLGVSVFALAKGGVIDGGVKKFAAGGIVNIPTIFPMAHGYGLMGEAGAEAIMPLTRTRTGDLGVRAETVQMSSSRAPNIINLHVDGVKFFQWVEDSYRVGRFKLERS